LRPKVTHIYPGRRSQASLPWAGLCQAFGLKDNWPVFNGSWYNTKSR
jgi:hypothetical protein